MKKQAGIWIDGTKAVCVSFVNGHKHIYEIPAEIENRVYHGDEGDSGTFMGDQHVSSERKFTERKKQQENKFFNAVLDRIKDMDELCIMGPAQMKSKLAQKIVIDEPGILIRSVEPAEAMSQNQLVHRFKEFFNR